MGAKSVRLLMLCFMIGLFSGCSKEKEEVWLTIGDEPVYKDEVMLYLYQTFNEFEEYGGKDVWFIEDFSGSKSAAEVAKQGAVDNLIKNKVLYQKAEDLGILLDDQTRTSLENEAKSYYALLPDSFVASNNIELPILNQIFIENHMADEVADQTMSEYVLSKDEVQAYVDANEDYARLSATDPFDILTNYRVHHLMIRTHEQDEDGQWIPLTQDERTAVEERMNVLYDRLLEGEDFIKIVKAESDADYYLEQPEGLILNKAQLSEEYMTALEQIEVGQMTGIINGEYGYHVFLLEEKTEPTSEELQIYGERFDEWKKALLAEAELKATKGAFDLIYKRWRSSTTITYSQVWIELDFTATIKTFIEKGNEQ